MTQSGVTVALVISGILVLIATTAWSGVELTWTPWRGPKWPMRRKAGAALFPVLVIAWFLACAYGASHANDPVGPQRTVTVEVPR